MVKPQLEKPLTSVNPHVNRPTTFDGQYDNSFRKLVFVGKEP